MSNNKYINALQLIEKLKFEKNNKLIRNNINNDFFKIFEDSETRDYIDEITESQDLKIINYEGVMYLIPLPGSNYSITENEIRVDIGKTVKERNLFYFIVLTFINEMYNGINMEKINIYITIENLLSAVNDNIAKVESLDKDIEKQNGFNYKEISVFWSGLKDELLANMGNKLGFLLKTINILSEYGIVYIDKTNDKEIEYMVSATPRLDAIIVNGIFQQELMNVILEKGNDNNGIDK